MSPLPLVDPDTDHTQYHRNIDLDSWSCLVVALPNTKNIGVDVRQHIMLTGETSPFYEVVGLDTRKNLGSNWLYLSKMRTIDSVASWLAELHDDFLNTATTGQTLELFTHLNSIVKSDRIGDLEFIIKQIPNLDVSHELMVSILRFSYPIKDELQNWDYALDQIQKKIAKSKLNVDEILYGLI